MQMPVNKCSMTESFSLPVVADTAASLSFFAKNGYYQVGQRAFNHKVYAMQEATRTGQDVSWNFNKSTYDQVNWMQTNGRTLDDLYRDRAWQLRQKYKWLCLAWSGGGDSTTVLHSFLLNNIHLDEVVILWPHSRLKGRYNPSKDTRPQNMSSEWDFAIEPKLRWLQQNYPRVQVTICDVLSDLEENECHDDTILIAEKHSYSVIQRWRALDQVLRQRTDQHGSVAGILAVDTPFVKIIDDWLCVYFDDMAANAGSKSDVMPDGWARNIEFFYWTPDMPEIVREQAQALLLFLNQYPHFRKAFACWETQQSTVTQTRRESSETARRLKKAVLYPSYDHKTFQVQKQTNTHHSPEWFHWFHSDPHAQEYLEPWQHAINAHQALIHPKFFVKNVNGNIGQYLRYQSPLYTVGKLHLNDRQPSKITTINGKIFSASDLIATDQWLR
jgi:hypothetical protein